jgi:CO dehydrogenase/acetyl-CoA synthase beta subunit
LQKEELNNWRSRFDLKVKEVDASYCEQIEELKRRLYDTKAAYIDKCAVLHRERVQHEEEVEVRATSAKNMMKQVIQSRIRTEMPLTAGQELVDVKAEIRKAAQNKRLELARRNSAPGSLQEEKRAYVSIAQLSEQSKKTPR